MALRQTFRIQRAHRQSKSIILRRFTHEDVRVRFAPSPTGQLHLGGLRTALYNHLFARSHNGRFILRVEDTDQTRLVPGAMERMIDMLTWAGIQIDEGPIQGGDFGPYIQSQRLHLYKEHIQALLNNETAYPCFCSPKRLALLRKEALRRREVPKYDNRCRHLTPDERKARLDTGEEYTIRLKLDSYTEPWEDIVYGSITCDVSLLEGDPVLMKTDGFPTYHLANVVDDHLMNISHVLRGVEWQVSTTKHLLLYKAFGWNPPKFAHLPLILNKDGSKLSKRQNDIHVEYIKNQGIFPESITNLLTSMGSGFKVGNSVDMEMGDLNKQFDLSLMKTNSTKLDLSKMTDINRRHLQAKISGTERQNIITEVQLKLIEHEKEGLITVDKEVITSCYIGHILDWAQHRISKIDELFSKQYMFLWVVPEKIQISQIGELTIIHKALHSTMEIIQNMSEESEELNIQDLQKEFRQVAKDNKLKFPTYMKLLRSCLSGLKEGPSVGEMISMLGKKTTLERLNGSLKDLNKDFELSQQQ